MSAGTILSPSFIAATATTTPTDNHDAPTPGLTRAATLPIELHATRSARSHLAPEDAFNTASPSRRQSGFEPSINDIRAESRSRKMNSKLGSRSRSRRRRRTWKKLLWVKQSCMTFIAQFSSEYIPAANSCCKIPIITRTKLLSWRTYSATRASSPTNFGRSSPILPLSSSRSAP